VFERAGSPGSTLTDAAGPIWFSEDGAVMATIDPGLAVQFWDVATHQKIHHLPPVAESAAVSSFALAPDGNTWAVGLKNGAMEIWDLRNGRRHLLPNDDGAPAQALCFSLKQDRLASVHNPSINSTENPDLGANPAFKQRGASSVTARGGGSVRPGLAIPNTTLGIHNN
jgi:WD40 repeat protein